MNSESKAITTWEIFKREIIKSFPGVCDSGEILLKIMSRKKRTNECIENYFYEIVALGKQIQLSEVSIIKYIISGLQNENLKGSLLGSNCSTTNSLLQQIKQFEEIEKQTASRNKILGGRDNKPESSFRPRYENQNDVKYKSYRNTPYPSRNYKENGFNAGRNNNGNYKLMENRKCFNCNDHGHLANRCPNKLRVCFNCRKEGHFAKDCSVKKMLQVALNLGP